MTTKRMPPLLDADIVDHLHDALVPEPMDAELAARVKRRVLQRIAEEQRPQHLTVHAHDGVWQPFGPGVQLKLLHAAGDIWSYLLKLEPGAHCRRTATRSTKSAWCSKAWCRSASCAWPPAAFTSAARTCCTHRSALLTALLFLRGARPEAELVV